MHIRVLMCGVLQVELTRWDLFHAHIFFTPQDRGIGLLFHAKEYPRQCEAFPYDLGYCQRGSPLEFHEKGMDFRNLLYFQVMHFSHLCNSALLAAAGLTPSGVPVMVSHT